MKSIMENWRGFVESNVIQGPWKSPMETAVDEFQQIFGYEEDDEDLDGMFSRSVVMDFMHHLETKEVEPALRATGLAPETMGMDQLGEVYMWVEKWFKKQNML